MANRVSEIIDACGLSKLSRELGHSHVSRVQGWRDRGRVPSDEIPAFLEAANRILDEKAKVTTDDVIGPPPEKATAA